MANSNPKKIIYKIVGNYNKSYKLDNNKNEKIVGINNPNPQCWKSFIFDQTQYKKIKSFSNKFILKNPLNRVSKIFKISYDPLFYSNSDYDDDACINKHLISKTIKEIKHKTGVLIEPKTTGEFVVMYYWNKDQEIKISNCSNQKKFNKIILNYYCEVDFFRQFIIYIFLNDNLYKEKNLNDQALIFIDRWKRYIKKNHENSLKNYKNINDIFIKHIYSNKNYFYKKVNNKLMPLRNDLFLRILLRLDVVLSSILLKLNL